MRVLIADDDIATVRLLTRALERQGFDVVVAHDGASAWDRIVEFVPSLAILDWAMPGPDGLELCRQIRATPAHAHMYLLLLTGRAEPADIVAGLEAGADDYITKPPDFHELRARVQVGVRVVQASVERERLLESMSSILITVDANGQVTRWNAAAQETFGMPAAAVVGRPLRDCGIAWIDPATVSGLLEHGKTPAHLDDLAFVDVHGATRLVGLTVTTLQREDAAPPAADGFVVFGSEVTTRRALEQQLRQAQKLESVGQLAAGIAHEINTPMQYVGDNVRFLQEAHGSLAPLFDSLLHLGNGEHSLEQREALVQQIIEAVDHADLAYMHAEMPRAIQQSLDGVQHVSRIVKAMKDFSHPGTEAKIAVDLNRAIETTLTVAKNELKYVADTVTDLDPDLPLVPCLPGEVNQVLLNLLINAAHAIADAGSDHAEQARGRIVVSTRAVVGGVEMRVSDTGAGIPEPVWPRIFEPFFTTKAVGRGTGQGLALAHAVIVKRHGGRIWFETQAGAGTTFIVRLPVDGDSVAGADAVGDGAISGTRGRQDGGTAFRRANRVVPGPLRVRHDGSEGVLLNISQLGALIRLAVQPPLNSRLTVEVAWEHATLQLAGRVVRANPSPEIGAATQFDVAIEFASLPAGSESALRGLLGVGCR